MPTQIDKKTTKSKAFIMDTIMRDPKTAKIMMEAWDAPVGSTKRAKAKSILKSLHKTHQNYGYMMDGMGGPGQPVMTQNPLEAFVQSITKKKEGPTTLSSGATVQPEQQSVPQESGAPNMQIPVRNPLDPTINNITSEQVRSAFESFGYEPDQNNMNDTGYWMTKPVTDISRLMSELRKRRVKDNEKLEQQQEAMDKEARLSPERIKQVYDSHGLLDQATDENIPKIQSVLPNNEEDISSILKIEQKRKLQEYKDKLLPKKKVDGKGGAVQDGKGGGATTSLSSIVGKTPPSRFSQGASYILPTITGMPEAWRQVRDYTKQNITPWVDYGRAKGLESILSTPEKAAKWMWGDSTKGYGEDSPTLYPPTSTPWGTPTPSTVGQMYTPPTRQASSNKAGQDYANQLYDLHISKGDTVDQARASVYKLTGIIPSADRASTGANLSAADAAFESSTGYSAQNINKALNNKPVTKGFTAADNAPTGAAKPQTGYESIQSAITNNIGPTAFAMSLLGNKKKLAEFLGMPEAQIATFWPKDSSLLEAQLPEIYNAASKARNLDAMEQMMLEASARNLNIQDNLSAYVRGKDEYLGTIDKLIDQGIDTMAKTDTSNPYVAKQLNGYMNYLNILQGRQNTRYVNMLDLAIKSDNNKYQQTLNTYNMLDKKVTQEYEQAAAITKGFYDNTMAMIKEMYANVGDREKLAQTTFDNGVKKVTAMADSASKALDVIKKQQAMGLPADINQFSFVYPKGATESDTDYVKRLQGYASGALKGSGNFDKVTSVDDTNKLMGIKLDENKKLTFSNYDILSAVDTVSSSQNYDPKILFNQYIQSSGENLYNKSRTGTFDSELSAYGPSLTEIGQNKDTDATLSLIYDNMNNALSSNIYKGLQEFLTSKKQRIKDALNALNKGSWISGATTDRTKFMSDFSDLGDAAGLLFDENVEAPINSADVDAQFDVLVKNLADRAVYGSNK